MGLKIDAAFFVAGLAVGAVCFRACTKPIKVNELPAPPERKDDGSLILERTGTGSADAPAPLVNTPIPQGATVVRRIQLTVTPKVSSIVAPQASADHMGVSAGEPSSTRVDAGVVMGQFEHPGVAATGQSLGERSPQEELGRSNHLTDANASVRATVVQEPPAPINIELTIYKPKGENGYRVIATTPDGVIVGGVDIPVAPMQVIAEEKVYKHALGVIAGYGIHSSHTYGCYYRRTLGRLEIGTTLASVTSNPGNLKSVAVGATAGVRF
jgi:hypothetical protein